MRHRIAPSIFLLPLVVLAHAPRVIAQTSCLGSSGPDVVCAGVSGPANYASSGDLEALSVGTTMCNMGDVWVNFFANTNQHPLTAGNLYRYKIVDSAGRFEQVGMGWLLHGFFALSQSLCCACTPTDGAHLGVGCNDVNNASINGSQSLLGPRWEVNAHTGAFAFPHANPPFAGSTARRIQVLIADLEPSGGTTRYFHETHFVTPDEALAGNDDNNASHRELSVSGSDSAWNFAFTGAIAVEQSAIRAWKAIDPAVTELDLRVPGEGLLVLGYRVTDLGGGQWHYEYALYNMNSDASVRAFSLAVDSGATLTNLGFHDVTYRDGDGPGNVDLSGTDWATSRAAGSVTWTTETFAANPSANALRWGTTYNFRFDADLPPASGTLTLGLYKTGGSLQTSVMVPSASGPVEPGTGFCSGDGSLPTACPCAPPNTVPNPPAAAGHGCANSFNPNGALLTAAGTTAPDTLQLSIEVSSNYVGFGFLLKGNAIDPIGLATSDGVLCVSGALLRFGGHYASTNGAPVGTWTYPNNVQTTPISTATAQPSGALACYQLIYRNNTPAFCSPATVNASNGYQLVWP